MRGPQFEAMQPTHRTDNDTASASWTKFRQAWLDAGLRSTLGSERDGRDRIADDGPHESKGESS